MATSHNPPAPPRLIVPSCDLFALGKLCATPAALATLCDAGKDASEYVSRHIRGDWGDLDADDIAANDRAVEQGTRILSAYEIDPRTQARIWILTEADRSVTTILLPNEY